MFRIRRFGVVRTATVVAVAYAIVFAIIAIPLALLALAAPRGAFGAAVAVLPFFLFVLLVVYPLLIWVFTALACLVYNLAARLVGGIEVDVERRPPDAWTAAPAWSPDSPQPWGGSPPWGGPPPGSPSPGSPLPGWGPPPASGGWPPSGGSGTSEPPRRP